MKKRKEKRGENSIEVTKNTLIIYTIAIALILLCAILILLFLSSFKKDKFFSPADDGLVAHYKFDGNANDYSGYNNHGTMLNGVNCNVAGKNGYGCLFDGVNDYINIDRKSVV